MVSDVTMNLFNRDVNLADSKVICYISVWEICSISLKKQALVIKYGVITINDFK